jgi:hypothetical protein
VNDWESDLRVNEPLGSCETVIETVPAFTIVAVVPAIEIILVSLLENENAPLLLLVGGVNVKGASPYVLVTLLTVKVPNVGTVAPTRRSAVVLVLL